MHAFIILKKYKTGHTDVLQKGYDNGVATFAVYSVFITCSNRIRYRYVLFVIFIKHPHQYPPSHQLYH